MALLVVALVVEALEALEVAVEVLVVVVDLVEAPAVVVEQADKGPYLRAFFRI